MSPGQRPCFGNLWHSLSSLEHFGIPFWPTTKVPGAENSPPPTGQLLSDLTSVETTVKPIWNLKITNRESCSIPLLQVCTEHNALQNEPSMPRMKCGHCQCSHNPQNYISSKILGLQVPTADHQMVQNSVGCIL